MKLRKSEVQKIENTIKDVEKRTQGEIVPAIISSSDTYLAAHFLLSLLLTLFVGVIGSYLSITQDILIFSMIVAAFCGYFLADIAYLKRILTGAQSMAQEVHERGISLFLNNNLHHTIDRNGIIIVVSLLEHRVEIIADKGINDVIEKRQWDELVGELIQSIKKGQIVEGICHVIDKCGDLLEEHFPAKSDNPNEISNKLVTDLQVIE